jgi:hypothetical protein
VKELQRAVALLTHFSWLLSYATGLGSTQGQVSTGMSHPLLEDIGSAFVCSFLGSEETVNYKEFSLGKGG